MALSDNEAARLEWVLNKAQTANNLTPFEQKFVGDIQQRFETYGGRLSLSEKQWEILERIAEERV